MGETIRTLRNEGQDPHQVVPHLVAAYQVALQYQHYIVEQNNEALQQAQREDYLRIVAASTQFASEVSLSINYAKLSAEQRAEDIGKSILQALDHQAGINAAQIQRIGVWAEEQQNNVQKLREQARLHERALMGFQQQVKNTEDRLKKTQQEMEKKIEERVEQEKKWRKRNVEKMAAEQEALRKAQLDMKKQLDKATREGLSTESVKGLRRLLKDSIKKAPSMPPPPPTPTAEQLAAQEAAITAASAAAAAAAATATATAAAAAADPANTASAAASVQAELDAQAAAAASVAAQQAAQAATDRGRGDPDSSSSSSDSSDSSDDEGPSGGGGGGGRGGKGKTTGGGMDPDGAGKLGQMMLLKKGKIKGEKKKPQIGKPESFNGALEPTPLYRVWHASINRYLRYHAGTWSSDEDLITIVGSFMKDIALDWFDSRATTLSQNHKVDTFAAFVEAMDERFKTDEEDKEALKKLRAVKYKGNVLEYLDSMRTLNLRAGLYGLAWREALKNGLDANLRSRLAYTAGGVPKEDEALIACIKEHGLASEELIRDEKSLGNTQSGGSGQGKGKRKRGSGKGGDAKDDSAPAPKRQQKGKGTTSGSGDKGGNTPRFTDDQKEEALKGVQETLRASRIKKKLCQRCALSGHHWKYCRKEINVSSSKKKKTKKDDKSKEEDSKPAETAKASSVGSKRKREPPTNTVSTAVHPVSCEERILADLRLKAGVSKRARVVASAVKAEDTRPAWELKSSDEELD